MITIAIANHKGGTGKTETAYRLARSMGRLRIETLVLDLDPQANLSHRWHAQTNVASMRHVLGGAVQPSVSLRKAAQQVDDHVRLVPADIELANTAHGLANRPVGGTIALRKAMANAPLDAEVCLIDCPSDLLGILTINALVASDYVIIPAEPEGAAIAGIQSVANFLPDIAESHGHAPAVLGVIATRVEMQVNRHKDGLGVMEGLGHSLLGIIPKRSGVESGADLDHAYDIVASAAGYMIGVLESAEC